MAAAPYYKAYTEARGYVASFKFPEDAAQFAASQGEGTKIKTPGRRVLWHEGHETQSAAESYDHAAEIMIMRRDAF